MISPGFHYWVYSLPAHKSAIQEHPRDKKGIYLDANEYPFGRDYENCYPDATARALVDEIAKYERVKPENIILGFGSDQLFDLIIRSLSIEKWAIQKNSYPVHKHLLEINGICHEELEDIKELNVSLPRYNSDPVKRMEDGVIGVVVVNPGNPSGLAIKKKDLTFFKEGWVVVDEAYNWFSSEPSWVSEVRNGARAFIVLKTFSKLGGAGLRIAYAVAHEDIIEGLRKVQLPYPVAAHSCAQALELLENREGIIERTKELKSRLSDFFRSKGYKVLPTATNFILVDLGKDAEETYQTWAARRLFVRKTPWKNILRVSIASELELALMGAIVDPRNVGKEKKPGRPKVLPTGK